MSGTILDGPRWNGARRGRYYRSMVNRAFDDADIGRDFLATIRVAPDRAVRVRVTVRSVEPDGYRVEIRTPWLDAASERAWAESHPGPELGLVHLTDEHIELAEPWEHGRG